MRRLRGGRLAGTAALPGPGYPVLLPVLLTVPLTLAAAVPQPVVLLPRPAAGCPPQLGVRRLTRPPWAQQALDITGAWAASRGRGVTVAVVDSGVDYSPQLAGRVTEINLTGQGPRDCVGHGTAVASIIAASDARGRGVPFYGVAPAARILSVKVNTGDTGTTRLLAQGIRDAVADGAQVINVSIQTAVNSPALRAAVAFALRRNAVVVAAAGNDNPGGGVGPYYPASYPGVLSVGAVDETGDADQLHRPEDPGVGDRARREHRQCLARRLQPGQPGHQLRGRVRVRGGGAGPGGLPAADRGPGGAPDRGDRRWADRRAHRRGHDQPGAGGHRRSPGGRGPARRAARAGTAAAGGQPGHPDDGAVHRGRRGRPGRPGHRAGRGGQPGPAAALAPGRPPLTGTSPASAVCTSRAAARRPIR